VGVFVDETAEVIAERSAATGLSYVQLHGDEARHALPNIPSDMKVIYVLGATPDGVVQTLLPSQISPQSERLVSIDVTQLAIGKDSPA
jgi:phosphoribosylanthranilate isomerase